VQLCSEFTALVHVHHDITAVVRPAFLEGPTSPRIVTGNQYNKVYVDVDHCTVNTFIHKHPIFTLLSLLYRPNLSGSSLSQELSKEQYLSLKEPLNKTMKINGSSTTSLQIRSRPDTNTKRTEKGRLKIQRSEGSYIHEIKGDSTLKNDTLKYI
jgi:hypothetical protein